MARAFIIVLDSFGIGAAPDAKKFGDIGADTLGNIAKWCAEGNTNKDRPIAGPLTLPTLIRLGLGKAGELATGSVAPGLETNDPIKGLYGACAEKSSGKDTPSGHWEMAGVPVMFDWGYFGQGEDAFPQSLLDDLCSQANLTGTLGNKATDGLAVIRDYADEHIQTGKPIVYTSADSVIQIAAHEDHFGLERLYEVCNTARKLVNPYNIGRVIARPFVGKKGAFTRTENRRDISTPPPEETLLDKLKSAGREVISIGKVADIFAHSGITQSIKANGIADLMDKTFEQINKAPNGALVFTNLVNFDQDFGHRRNVGGYANALEKFDPLLKNFMSKMKPNDLMVLTADHGCDPTMPGFNHTREFIPFLGWSPNCVSKNLGIRNSFADIGQTVAKHLHILPLDHGVEAFIMCGTVTQFFD
jgi:phosphopentomutase